MEVAIQAYNEAVRSGLQVGIPPEHSRPPLTNGGLPFNVVDNAKGPSNDVLFSNPSGM